MTDSATARNEEFEVEPVTGSQKASPIAVFCTKNAKYITYGWSGFVSFYWTLLVIIPCAIQNNLAKAQYFTWWGGMIGTLSMYYAIKADHTADSEKGKPIVAFTTTAISVDWCIHAYNALDSGIAVYDALLMFFHSIALFWATFFFYQAAIHAKDQVFGWFTILAEWVDMIFMIIATLVLHSVYDGCLHKTLCIGYYSILVIQMVVWFLPIMLGQAETSKAMHIHLLVLDSVTDLPLVIILIATQAYEVHWFIFVDTIVKLLLLVRSIGYHGFYHLIIYKPTEETKTSESIDNSEKKKTTTKDGKKTTTKKKKTADDKSEP